MLKTYLDFWEEEEGSSKKQPNRFLQARFVESVQALKIHIENDYQLDYLINLAGFDFLSKDFQVSRKQAAKIREEFLNLEDVLSSLKVYKDLSGENVLPPSKFTCPEFASYFQDPRKAVSLSDKEQIDLKEEANGLLS